MSERIGSIELRDALRNPDLLRGPVQVLPRLAFAGRVTALGSAPKDGKSTLLGQAVAAFVRGDVFLGEPVQAGNAVWIAIDEPLGDTVVRLDAFGASDGVTLFTERPGMAELEDKIMEKSARVVVIDTLTEFVSGIVEDGNLQAAWQPILRAFRQIAQRTDCGVILLDHTGKSNPNSLLGSTQKAAGVDLILTMTPDASKPNVRHFRARGRVPCSAFSLTWDGERNNLGAGELSLDTRIYYAVSADPGISSSKLRSVVSGKAKLIDKAVEQLLARGMIVDACTVSASGHITGHSYSVILPADRTGVGQGRDNSTSISTIRIGPGGTAVGQGQGQGTPSPTLVSVGGDRGVDAGLSDDEFERLAIQDDAGAKDAA